MSYNLLKGKRGIIFGALNDKSIAWKVAERAVEEGATITLSNAPVAVRMGEISALGEKLNAEIIAADATSYSDLENVFLKSMEILGGQIDFVLHSIGMSPNVRKKRTYDDIDYEMMAKTFDISAISFHKMLQSAKKNHAIADGGSVIALSGESDIISDGKETVILKNGCATMSRITGSGCMVTSMIGAFCGAMPEDGITAVCSAMAAMGIAGEKAEADRIAKGTGNATFRTDLIDAVFNMTGEGLNKGARYEIIR